MLVLLVVSAGIRVALSVFLGLGIDESYMVASGRALHWGYFDHPPASWWMVWAATHLAGSEAGWVVRAPFIALFVLSTWLLYRLTSALFNRRAGLLAALAFNLAPVFGITTGGWVLPDGPLVAALLGAALCLVQAMPLSAPADRRVALGWWLGAGLGAGLALFSKYSAVLTLAGALLYLATQPQHRRWLARREPYSAALVAAAVFSPVLLWNATHGWASFAFQGGRAAATRLHPWAPLTVLGGEALFLLPWIWAGLMLVFIAALRRGPGDWRGWLLACLGAPPILLFSLVALWSSQHVLYHWAAPGYLMLFPLLGAALDRRLDSHPAATRAWVGGSLAAVLLFLAAAATELQYRWLSAAVPSVAPALTIGRDAEDWISLRPALEARGLLADPGLLVGTLRWQDAGKIDYALGGAARVICLNPDARQYRFAPGPSDYIGRDVLVIFPVAKADKFTALFAPLFRATVVLPPVTVTARGRDVVTLALVIGRGLQSGRSPALQLSGIVMERGG